MDFVNMSPGVYAPETASPPSVVPDVTISRLMLIGKLPWTDNAKEDKRTWACTSWRDVVNQAYRLDPDLGPAAVLELCKNLSWKDGKPTSLLGDRFARVQSKLISSEATKSKKGTSDESEGTKSKKTPADEKGELAATKSPLAEQEKQLAGHIALTLWALQVYFEHGGRSVIVFEAQDLDNDPGKAFNQQLLQEHDIGIVCAPGRSKAFYGKLRDVCGKRDNDPEGDAFCFVLIDAPKSNVGTEFFDRQYDIASHSSACFGPWLRQLVQVADADGKERALLLEMPPSPAVAGALAACDASYGPARAAAGLGFTIKGNWELTVQLSDTEAGEQNEKGRNQLRQFGRAQPPVIWGARTLSENIDLQYIPVARVLLALRKAIKRALRSFVFHPNDVELRQWVYRMLYGYLEDRRRKGWLKGESAGESFEITFPTSVEDEKKGILRVRVEVALARPAEFIEVEITQIQEFAA